MTIAMGINLIDVFASFIHILEEPQKIANHVNKSSKI